MEKQYKQSINFRLNISVNSCVLLVLVIIDIVIVMSWSLSDFSSSLSFSLSLSWSLSCHYCHCHCDYSYYCHCQSVAHFLLLPSSREYTRQHWEIRLGNILKQHPLTTQQQKPMERQQSTDSAPTTQQQTPMDQQQSTEHSNQQNRLNNNN